MNFAVSSYLYIVILALILTKNVAANTYSIGFKTPSEEFARLVEVQSKPDLLMSPDNKWLAFLTSQTVGYEKKFSPSLDLFNIKFNPYNFSRVEQQSYTDIEIKHVVSGSVLSLNNLPAGKIRDVKWSANSRFVSLILEQVNSATLWSYDVKTRRLEQITQSTLNGFLTDSPYQWLPDSTGFIVNIAVNHGKPLLEKPVIVEVENTIELDKEGLVIAEHFHPTSVSNLNGVSSTDSMINVSEVQQESIELSADVDNSEMISDPVADQFKFFSQGQLLKVSLSGLTKPIGKATFLNQFSISPDSTNLIVQMIDDPIDSSLSIEAHANVWQIWGMTGHPLYQLATS